MAAGFWGILDVNFQTIFVSFQVSGWQTLKRNAVLRGMPHVGQIFLTSVYINDKAILRSPSADPLCKSAWIIVFSAEISLKGKSLYGDIQACLIGDTVLVESSAVHCLPFRLIILIEHCFSGWSIAWTKPTDYLTGAHPLPTSPHCVCGGLFVCLVFNWEYSPDAFVIVFTHFLLVWCKT